MFFSLDVDDGTELQLLEEDHAEQLFRLVADARTHLEPWLPWVRETTRPEHLRTFVERTRERWGDGTGVHCAIIRRNELCGATGANVVGDTADLTYWLHPEFEGNGIATRSVRDLVDYAFEHHEIHRCTARVAPENVRGRALPERLGFTHEATLRGARPHPDGSRDLEVWALLRSEH